MPHAARKLFLIAGCLTVALRAIAAEPPSAPERLPSTTPWNVAALQEAPAFEWVDSEGPVRSLFYTGEPYREKPTRVFAYYATPGTLSGNETAERNLPAVVLVHGGGGTAFREWAELWARRGYAAIAMDLAGYRPIEGENPHQRANRTRLPAGGPDQGDGEKFGSVDLSPRQQWPYHAVAAAVRAHSLIRDFPEVDPRRTAVTGISWGGYLTCIIAAVDARFKAAVPVYGCGFLHKNSAWLKQFAMMTEAQQARWVSLWDPSQYLPAVSMPILFVNGTNDFAYPLDSYMRSFDAVPGFKQLRITVNLPHSHPAGWRPVEIGRFIDQYLRDGEPMSRIAEPRIQGDKVHAAHNGTTEITAAALHVTHDTGPINQRTWTTSAATLHDHEVTVAAPGPTASAWFLTLTDAHGAVVSSRVWIAP